MKILRLSFLLQLASVYYWLLLYFLASSYEDYLVLSIYLLSSIYKVSLFWSRNQDQRFIRCYCMKNVCYFPGIHHGPSLYADRRNNSWNIADHKSTRTSLMKNLHLFSYISALIAYLTFPFLMVIRPDWTMIYEFLDSSWWNGIRMYSIKCKF